MAVYKITPTKGNLIKIKKSLDFAEKGYDLLDRKRVVLVKEMMSLVDKSKKLQEEIEVEFERAYNLLKEATITMGRENLDNIAEGISKEERYNIVYKSIMGAMVPTVFYKKDQENYIDFGMYNTNPAFDKAIKEFIKIKDIIYELAEIENSVYNLAKEIKKTKKRANALDKIQIPRYKEIIKETEEILEEKNIEEFFRLKKIKSKN
ncbi:V-type ATP synthase subunit D [Miniphocaeibacter halophilus]|uniref:V-type ATP synthase subunit D n=1 Tax=Miniphocaeibacter halophilus TaxID=2931922 RepID=A0AC61MQY5_9FIRM|nr:V-type ATP synthase subunit D [Miniphocaeibacter halophilus]QQK07364.1 V-type ATP synthase subunit D [Miniphocaeibacter halophilus]